MNALASYADRAFGLLPDPAPRAAAVHAVEVVTPPAGGWGAYLSLAACKEHLRVGHGEDDAEITAMRDAAARWCLEYLRSAGLVAAYRARYAGFPGGSGSCEPIALPVAARPALAVTQVAYDDDDGDEQTLAVGVDVGVDAYATPPLVHPLDVAGRSGWPRTRAEALGRGGPAAVRIAYTAGAADADALAAHAPQLRSATLVLLTHLYTHRGDGEGAAAHEAVMLCVKGLLAPGRGGTL